jgi:hypothetical protein
MDYYKGNAEHAVHEHRDKAYKILNVSKKTEKDKLRLKPVTEKQ